MTQPLLKRARLATAISLVSATFLITGCNLSEGDRTTHEDAERIKIEQLKAAKSQVVGIVQDTNGNPIAGATVSIGIATAKTDKSGVYYLKNVPVSGVNAHGAAATPLEIAIVPPTNKKGTNYLSATVSVTPTASTVIQSSEDGATVTNTANDKNSLIAYIQQDGLAISAGVAVIPALGSNVKGVLRNIENGLPVAGAVVGLDVLGVNGVDQQQVQNATAPKTSYGVATYQVATNAEGVFEFTNLPVDTEFRINVDNWKNVAGGTSVGNTGALALGGHFATTDETTNQNIGDFTVKFINTVDTIDPFVLSVSEVHQNGAIGKLKDQVNGTEGLTINFSEPVVVSHIEDSIYIKNITKPEDAINVASAELGPDGKSLVIKTVEPIAEGVIFEIHLNRIDYRDLADNNLEAGPATFNDKTIANYDANDTTTINPASGNIGTLKLTLQTYARAILQSGAVVDLEQQFEDGRTSDFETLLVLNKTFQDIDSGSLRNADVEIEQLNAKEAATRLQALANATYAPIGLTPPTVDTTTARATFTLDNSTPSRTYKIELLNSTGTKKVFTLPEVTADAEDTLTFNGAGDIATLKVKNEYEGAVELIVKSGTTLEHGDRLVIKTVNDLGIEVAETELELEDKIAPTTVLQNNYGLGDATSAVVTPNYGDGGELANNGSADVGTPLFNVTARLLTPQVGDVPLAIGETWTALTDAVDRDTNGNKQVSDAGLGGFALYDAKAWTTWNGVADARTRSVGIAFSEDITLTGTPAFGGTAATLSAWSAQNNVVQNDQGVVVAVDLANVTVSDIVKLANDDHGSVIDFSNVIKDAVGNVSVADNNAKVVIRDRLPPVATSAVYKGDSIEVTFNEALGDLTSDSEVVLDHAGAIASLDVAGNASLSTDRKTLTIDAKAWGVAFTNKNANFARGDYDHDNDAITADRSHGALKFTEIADQRGNTWANSNPGVAEPAIVIRDDVGTFDATRPSGPNISITGGNRVILTFNFTHRIDPASLGFAAGNNNLSAAATAALFTNTAAINTGAGTATGATLNANGRVLTVTLEAPFVSGVDTISPNATTVASAWDNAVAPIALLTSVLTVQ